MKQRAIRHAHVVAALEWGHIYRQADGRTAYFLGKRHVAAAGRAGVDVCDYTNTAVVVAADGALVTVIRTASTHKLREATQGRRGGREQRSRVRW